MNNFLVKGMAYDRQARVVFVSNTHLVRTLMQQQGVGHRLLRHALGSTLTLGSLLIGTLKDRQRLSLTIRASQSPHSIFVDVDAEGNVRGYLSDNLAGLPSERLDEISLYELIGSKGSIQMVKDIGMYRSMTGITDMPYRNISGDLSHYFEQSEQTPTWFATDLMIDEEGELLRSSGLMIQVLPGYHSNIRTCIQETLDAWPSFAPQAAEYAHGSVEIIRKLCPSFEMMAMESLQSYCGCSKEMMTPMLYVLGRDPLIEAISRGEKLEISCRICGKFYDYTPAEIGRLV